MWVPCAIVGFCLNDHREGIRKRDAAPAWASRLEVSERGGIAVSKKHIQEGYSSRCSRSSEDFSTSDPDKGTRGLQLQESGDECFVQRQRGLCLQSGRRKGQLVLLDCIEQISWHIRPWGE